MSGVFRLGTDLPPEFSSPLIRRDKTINFTLNGRRFVALEGDSVLSALLANGIISAGMQSGHAVALDADSAPPIMAAGSEAQMPMALCPAINGARFRTAIPRKRTAPIKTLFGGNKNSLELDLDSQCGPGNWIDAEPDETLDFDVVVVGGGIAGMSAALAAAKSGSRVALVEREPVLGGMTVFFGKIEGETPPEETVSGLCVEIASHNSVRVFTRAEAFEVAKGLVRVVQIAREDTQVRPVRLALTAPQIVLATGTEERLPIFPGNRLPGVMGAAFVWRMARLFNVWPGGDFQLHTATNAGYRLAILGSEAGRIVQRASDPRSDPRTRFIEFCKAYGFRFGWGIEVTGAKRDRNGLAIRFSGRDYGGGDYEPAKTSAMILSGGWQPAIDLWIMAGGGVVWDEKRDQLRATGAIDSIVLAGSVTGVSGALASIESGRASIDELRDGQRRAIADPQIAEIYESRDGPLTFSAPPARDLPPAWLGPARRMAVPEPRLGGIAAFIRRQPVDRPVEIGAVNVPDIAGAIVSGALDSSEAASFSRQWCIVPLRFTPSEVPSFSPEPEGNLPDYLVGRFGLSQSIWSLRPEAEREFEPGSLVFINTDDTQPSASIGVVVSDDEKGCIALMARTEFGAGDLVYVRDGATITGARLGRKI